MKAKHLLFSGIFLSMGFAACTNEVEEFAPQAQDKDFPAVELGKDFSINVTNADFSADAATRAAFEKVGTKWIASWQENDIIGAAWFNKFVYDKATGKVSESKNVFKGLDEYGSNSAFVWQGGTVFQSEAISKLGAYVLYYPYNEAITDNMKEIPVVEIKGTQPFDVQNPTAQVTANMTAANVAVFGQSGNQAPTFTVEQIPNLYALSFYIQNEALLELDQPVKITHVMLEVDDKAAKFNTNGIIKPTSCEITPETYNGEAGAPAMPTIDFDGAAQKEDRIIVEVANGGKNSDYYIRNTGKENGTEKFYFSLLPTEELTKNVTFKIIGKVGQKTKVFTKTVDIAGDHLSEEKEGFAWKMSQKGKVINLAVELTHENTETGIYSVDQFVENWVAEDTKFTLAVPMDLTKLTAAQKKKVNFTLPEDKHVIFEGEKVTLPAVEGMYTFNNEVKIVGDAKLAAHRNCECYPEKAMQTPSRVFEANAEITGDLTTYGAQQFMSNSVLTVGGNVYIDNANGAKINHLTAAKDVTVSEGTSSLRIAGTANVNGTLTAYAPVTFKKDATITTSVIAKEAVSFEAAAITGDITADAAVTIAGDATTGAINANAAVTIVGDATTGDITANEAVTIQGDATTGAINAYKDVTLGVAKQIASIEVNEDSKVTATSAVVTNGLTINKGLVTIPTLNVKDATVELEGELNVATKFDATGIVNAKGLINAKGGEINTLNITPNIVVYLENAVINTLNNNKTASYSGTLEITNGTIKNATNNGTINGNFTVTGTFDQNAVVDGCAIVVAKDATFNVKANTVADITNNGTVNVAAEKTLTDVNAIVNNATMTVDGTLTETISIVLGPDSKVIANGTVKLIGGVQPGEVKIKNGSTFTFANKPAKVSYDWNGVAPNNTIKNHINYYNAINVANGYGAFNSNATIDVQGAITFSKATDLSNNLIIVSSNSTLSVPSKKSYTITLGSNNIVSEGVVLTLNKGVTLDGGDITFKKGATVSGEGTITSNVKFE